MKIVIDITEELYEQCKDIDSITKLKRIRKNLTDAVKYGIPLPKNHGRLIDADMLPICHGVFLPRVNGNTLGCPADAVFAYEIDDAPTIIEADKESET